MRKIADGREPAPAFHMPSAVTDQRRMEKCEVQTGPENGAPEDKDLGTVVEPQAATQPTTQIEPPQSMTNDPENGVNDSQN